MSQDQGQWSPSQKNAFGFVRRAVSDGMSGRAGLRAFRAGGGKIGNEYWFSLYKTAFNIEGWKESIKQVPMTYNVRENMFTDSDLDWTEEFVVQMKVSGYSPEQDRRLTRWVTIESDKIITKQEWVWGAQQAVDDTLGSEPMIIDRVHEWEAMRRQKWV